VRAIVFLAPTENLNQIKHYSVYLQFFPRQLTKYLPSKSL